MSGAMLAVPPVDLNRTRLSLPPQEILVHDEDFVAALEAYEHALQHFAIVQSLELLEAFRAEVKPGLSVADHEFINGMGTKSTSSFDIHTMLEPFPAPALILAGRQDAICGYRETWALLDCFTRGTFAVLDRAGH